MTEPTTSTTVRQLLPSDVSTVAELEVALFGPDAWSEQTLADEAARADRIYRVAAADTVLGYAGIWLSDPLQIMTIGVAPAAQGRGLGRVLLDDLLSLTTQVVEKFAPLPQQNPQVMLEVRASNEIAQNLYRSAGFTPAGVRKNYYRNEDAIVMTRPLKVEG